MVQPLGSNMVRFYSALENFPKILEVLVAMPNCNPPGEKTVSKAKKGGQSRNNKRCESDRTLGRDWLYLR
jgi:hypothetical protein